MRWPWKKQKKDNVVPFTKEKKKSIYQTPFIYKELEPTLIERLNKIKKETGLQNNYCLENSLLLISCYKELHTDRPSYSPSQIPLVALVNQDTGECRFFILFELIPELER